MIKSRQCDTSVSTFQAVIIRWGLDCRHTWRWGLGGWIESQDDLETTRGRIPADTGL
jgi:hypothetical protein